MTLAKLILALLLVLGGLKGGDAYAADTWEEWEIYADPNQTYLRTVPNYYYEFVPKPDITAYELALILPVFIGNHIDMIEDLPPEARRHIKRVDY